MVAFAAHDQDRRGDAGDTVGGQALVDALSHLVYLGHLHLLDIPQPVSSLTKALSPGVNAKYSCAAGSLASAQGSVLICSMMTTSSSYSSGDRKTRLSGSFNNHTKTLLSSIFVGRINSTLQVYVCPAVMACRSKNYSKANAASCIHSSK